MSAGATTATRTTRWPAPGRAGPAPRCSPAPPATPISDRIAGVPPAPRERRRPGIRRTGRCRKLAANRRPDRTAEEPPMKVTNAIAQILKREGVEFLIGYPVNPIIEGAAEADIRPIMVRQERIGLPIVDAVANVTSARSEERRVGKEGRSRW